MKKGWEIKSLGEIADVEYGFTDKSTEEGDYRYVRITDINENGELISTEKKYLKHSPEATSFLLQENDLLMARTGATFAKVLLYKDVEPSVFASYLIRIKFKEKIENKLYWYFSKTKSYWDQANSLASGAAQPHFNGAAVKQVLFSYPKSLPEQQRIVSILDEAFAAIAKAKANAEQNLKNAEELFESYLQGVFENGGDGWEEKTFEELIQENQIGLIKSTKEQGNDKPYRYLKMDSITYDNNLIHDRYVYVEADKSELEKYSLNDGDFLFNTRNSYELVGKTCVFVPVDDEPTLFNNNIMRVVFKKGISSRFINYAFSSELVKERLQKLKSGTTSVVGIYYKGLRTLKIPITNYGKQQIIVRQLDALRAETQKLEAIYQKKIDDLEELKKSILQKAFAGELKTERAALI